MLKSMDPNGAPIPREWLLDVPLIVGKPLGISVMENTGVLTSVHKAGIIGEINERNPDLAVVPDDRITEVNGEVGDAVTLLKKALARHDKALRLRICRPIYLEVSVDLNGEDLGLVVEKSTGTVTAIRDGSAVARCGGPGVQIGDRVVKVNGREPGEDDSIMPWLRLAVAGGVSPLELELVRGSVPLDIFFGNKIRGLESTKARVGSCPRPDSDESETETDDGKSANADEAVDRRARGYRSAPAVEKSPVSDASDVTTDESAAVRRKGDRDRQDRDLLLPMFFKKTKSVSQEERGCKAEPRFSRLTRLRKLGERLILPNCSPLPKRNSPVAPDTSSAAGPAGRTVSKEFEAQSLPPLSRPASRSSSKEGHGLVLPIVSVQSTVRRDH